MNPFVITACSTSDLPAEYYEKRGVQLAYFHYILDGHEYSDDLGKTIPYEEFYRKIAAGALPTTSQVNMTEYLSLFDPILASGKDILHLSFSSALSGSYNSACNAKEELSEKYPERTIRIVDTMAASSGYGLILDTLCDMRDQGSTYEELYFFVEENKLSMHHWFFSTDLTHYKRGGRISATAATIGTILNLCPLMNMNYKGELTPRQKIRGKKKVILESLTKMQEHAQNGTDYSGKCFISQSACYDDAKQLADLIEATFPHLNGKVMINNVGTVIGSHTGPGTVALFFWGDKRVN